MARSGHFAKAFLTVVRSAVSDSTGSQIAEFAVSLPLLLIMVVGIFDFGNAYNIKQKASNIAREAARMGASQPTADLTGPTPPSILAIRDMVVTSLQAAKLNDCGLGSASGVSGGAAAPWKWTFTVSCGTPGNLVLTVDRGHVFTSGVIVNGTGLKVIGTDVALRYPYQWQFNRVITLVVPTAIYPGTTQIAVDALIPNES